MELPRYRSQALSQEATLSPQQAAAGAGAMGQAVASGLDAVAQVATQIGKAEAQAEAQSILADTQLTIQKFAADPRWQQAEINGEPTAEVLGREWKAVQAGLLKSKPKIRDRATAQAFDLQRRELVETAGIEIAGTQRTLQIDRGRALTDQSASDYLRMGQYDLALEAYAVGFESGLYSTPEYLSRRQKLLDVSIEDGYMVRATRDENLVALTTEILDDQRLEPGKRRAIVKTIAEEERRRDSDLNRQITARKKQNAVQAWLNVDALTSDQIARLDLEPSDSAQLILFKRTTELEGIDDPAAVRRVTTALGDLATGRGTMLDARDAILQERKLGALSPQRAQEMLQQLSQTDDRIWQDPRGTDLLRMVELDIGDGVPSDQLLTIFAKRDGEQLAAIAVRARRDFYDQKLADGANFDPEAWYRDRAPKYRQEATAVKQKASSSETLQPWRITTKGGKIDYAATLKEIERGVSQQRLTDLDANKLIQQAQTEAEAGR